MNTDHNAILCDQATPPFDFDCAVVSTQRNEIKTASGVDLDGWIERARKRMETTKAFCATQPQEIPCPFHPNITLKIDLKRSYANKANYEACHECITDEIETKTQDKLHTQGAPKILLGSTIENYIADTDLKKKVVLSLRGFLAAKKGFFAILGDVGTGKGHLSVAAMRYFNNAWFTKQSTLLYELRRSYGNRDVEDPIHKCKGVTLLVIDEVGLSAGGKDEFPMIHEILDYRFCEQKPTILNGNIELPELKEMLGPRLSNRMQQGAFAVHTIQGQSYRKQKREEYFK
jgi:DNA replication protein DnaC